MSLRGPSRSVLSYGVLVLAGFAPWTPVLCDDPSSVGQWSAVDNWPLVAVHAQLLPDGNVLMWTDYTNNAGAQVWNPTTDSFTPKTWAATSMFCAGHAYLSNGKLLVVGGIIGLQDDLGPRDTNIFDPVDESWSSGPLMATGRYYPTATTLPDGRVLVQGGTTVCSTCVADLPEIFDPASNAWTPMGESARKAFKYYPHTYVLPDGRILVAAEDDKAIAAQVLNLTTQTWTTIDASVEDGHSSVMYAPGKIMKSGKATADDPGNPSLASTYVLDMTQPSPHWDATAWMAYPRSYHTLTVLPDGNVVATGGSTTTDKANVLAAVYAAEIWSPVTKTWKTMSSAQIPREYHSTALLLPDARVLVAGGGRQNGRSQPDPKDQPNAEIFSPPYLFKGPRPVISSAPSLLQYGAPFDVTTPDASRIASVSLIALSAVTHAFNQNQRYVPLNFTQTAGGLTVTAPANGNLAPPGPYMLFLVDNNGVPSVASMVRIALPGSDAQAPTAPSGLTASVSTGRVDLSWGASSDNVGVVGYDVFRSTASGFTSDVTNRIAQTVGLGYSDQGMDTGTYYYVVRARDAAGNASLSSNQVTASVVGDTTAPSVPPNVQVAYAGPGQITLSWSAATDDVGVTDYRVERCTGSSCSGFVEVGTITGTGYDSLGLTAGTTYRFRVRAEDGRGNLGGYSGIVTGTTAAVSGGLVAAWGFNEGAGGSAWDLSGYANNGALSTATWVPGGKFGGGLLFNGGSSQVIVPDSASLDLTSGMTLEAWVNPGSTSMGWNSIMAKNTDRYYLMASSNPSGVPAVGGTYGSGNLNVYGPQLLPIGQWRHVAGTFDGTRQRLYINGSEVASSSQGGSLTTSSENLQIGADTYGEYFQGVLDELRIYNRALSVAEIQADMNTPVERGVVQFGVRRDVPTGNVVLSWADSAAVGSYRVHRATGPTPADFSTAACFLVQGTSFTDPAPANDGNSYYYLVDAGTACP